ncbi:MAG TPA: T9SS type A sorting domain-containing protein, partial [Flavobacterium sp.]|nr:T9SS type A sorting domain-containing protein [Flavobacterium sp.]
NAAGNLLWQKSFGGSGNEVAESIQQTTDGGYIVAGLTYSTDVDVSSNHGGSDYWVVKLSSTGTLEWEKTYGGTNNDSAYRIWQTADGSYVIAGYTASNDGDIVFNHGDIDYWIVKVNSEGTMLWQQTLGGSDTDYGHTFEPTTDGGFLLIGQSSSNDGNISGNHGALDYWVAKINASAELEWEKSLGGSGFDSAFCIKQTPDNGCIVFGNSSSNDFDVTGNHGDDYWIVKLAPESLSVADFDKNKLQLYPNPASTFLNLQLPDGIQPEKINITEVSGKIILQQSANTNSVNIENLSSGMYFIQCFSGNEKFQAKFIKQ